MQVHVAKTRRRPLRPGELLQVGRNNPAASNGALRQANRLLERQEYEDAEKILTRLVKEYPEDPEALASLAICVAAGRGQFATAEKLAKRSRSLAPRCGCGWFALGYVNLLGSRIEKGYRYLEEGRRRDPDDPRFQWGREVYEERRPGAIADLSRNNPLNRAVAAMRRVFTDRRVVVATSLYAVYQVAFFYFRLT
jgi:predicted Zn-dependent protease